MRCTACVIGSRVTSTGSTILAAWPPAAAKVSVLSFVEPVAVRDWRGRFAAGAPKRCVTDPPGHFDAPPACHQRQPRRSGRCAGSADPARPMPVSPASTVGLELRWLGLGRLRTRPQTSIREWAYAAPFSSSADRSRAMHPWLHTDNTARPHSAPKGMPLLSRINRDNVPGNASQSDMRSDGNI
jgi:hypothetical protein